MSRTPEREGGVAAASFWTLAVLYLMIVFASAAASPLYRVYQVQFGFSATTLTAIFAVYVVVLLLTLLFFGSVSDYLGRRPVMLAAVGCSLAERILHSRPGARRVGLEPTHRVRAGADAPDLVGIGGCPRQARAAFAGAIPCYVAVWALGGLYLSLGPSLVADAIASPNPVWGGLALMGAFRMITAQAAPAERAGLVAATFVMACLAFSVPALVAGVATTAFGLEVAALVSCAALADLAPRIVVAGHQS